MKSNNSTVYWNLYINIEVSVFTWTAPISRQSSFQICFYLFMVNIYSFKRWEKWSICMTKLCLYKFMEFLWCLGRKDAQIIDINMFFIPSAVNINFWQILWIGQYHMTWVRIIYGTYLLAMGTIASFLSPETATVSWGKAEGNGCCQGGQWTCIQIVGI